MKTYLKSLILITAVLALASCDSPTKRMEQAQALYNEGVQLREQRRSEEAAEKFLQGLALVQRSDKTDETIQLEGLRCYWIEDELVFKPGDEDCDAIYSEVHSVEEDGPSTGSGTFTVYPNPTNGVLFVETHDRASLPTD